MKIKFSKTQKKGMLISLVVIGVTGAFVFSKFNNSTGETNSPEQTSVGNQQQASNVTNTGPDVESLIDESSPIARSAREAEEAEAEETRNSGESYIGNVFLTERSNNPVIDIPTYQPEPEPEPEPEPIQVPGVMQETPENNGERRMAEITLEDIRNAGPTGSVGLGNAIPESSGQRRLAGNLTTFIEYDRENGNTQRNSNSGFSSTSQENSAPSMYEASSPTYRSNSRAATEENLRITLGSKFYATIGFAINSDDGGPALATLHEGPLKGAKLQGSYQLNELSKAVNITFDRMSFKGESYNISAIAYDLESERPVLADSVNNRRLERYGGLFLSAFVAGYADTLRDTTTNVTDGGNVISESNSIDADRDRITYALSEPARIMAEELRSNVNRPITVYVSNGRGTGIYFLDDVEI